MAGPTPDSNYILGTVLGKFRPRVVAALLDARLDGMQGETIYGKQAHLAIPYYAPYNSLENPGPNGTMDQTGEQ